MGATTEQLMSMALGVRPRVLHRSGEPISGPVPQRIGGVPDPGCYGCLGTGFVVGFGARPLTPCLHHVPDCEPDSCAIGCEHREHVCDVCGEPVRLEVEQHWQGFVDVEHGDQLSYVPTLHDHVVSS